MLYNLDSANAPLAATRLLGRCAHGGDVHGLVGGMPQ